MGRIRVGVIFGGKSAEHEVSLQSARNIVDALDRERFEVTLIGIDKQGQWHINEASDFLLNADDPARIALNRSQRDVALVPGREREQLIEPERATHLNQLDVIFPIVHGTLGEDGSLQGLLRTANLPFVGSGVLGSAVGMDKDMTKRLLRDAGLNVAPFATFHRHDVERADFDALAARLGTPLFVKPANQGSSVGVSRVDDAAGLAQALELALSFDHKVLVEAAVQGREIECAILGNETPEASVCGEIVVSGDSFYSYDTKYISDDGATIAVPADIDQASSDEIRRVAVRAFQTLECAGLARVDVFLTPQGQVVVNEVNTLPGFTRISMYPKLWQASGLSYSALVGRLIDLALARHGQDMQLKSSRHDD
ncbi:D-alanine--D-alanine ligase [Kushneria phosphatilytica]|uniref:D-alanine--D-alanine ligase n=1 Tax=Kushneria phosphatilytica TaxID=657387 RepID=A0A1S1NUA3_9GAMM|nr:D-alanine--D-alanine ligase [Kushneria phosphatilytica]OHV09009.1 D-alanine--D-alanine ligase A [Kushneria phosphatilytica]QEL09692.1 D-alanine--D-alanine ligase [Kushneria phosphatilytica]